MDILEKELLKKTNELFNSPEKWNAFLELTALKSKLIAEWNANLKDEIINKIKLTDEWEFNTNGKQWFLKEFGSDSLSIWLEDENFSLWANNNSYDITLINDKLKEPKYRSIYDGIIFKDIGFTGGYFFKEKGRFQFNSIYDNRFDFEHLAWYAGNQTEEYVKQIILKIQPFMEKPTTELMIELNRLARR